MPGATVSANKRPGRFARAKMSREVKFQNEHHHVTLGVATSRNLSGNTTAGYDTIVDSLLSGSAEVVG
jgi:hypothetical protein